MLRVMIVDDEAIAREGLRDLVDWQGLGMEVAATAANGEEALAYLLEHPVDILLTDIKMPRMDGLSLLREISERALSPTCIIFSGFNEFEYAQQAIQYGVLNYLLKPIRLDDLTETLRKAAQRRKERAPAALDSGQAARFREKTKPQADAETAEIARALCAGDEARVREGCARLRALIESEGYALEIARRYAFACVYELLRAVSRFTGGDAPLFEDVGRLSLLAAARGERELWCAHEQCVDSLCAHVHALRRSGRRRVVNDLLAMLHRRYGESGLALAQLAEELCMTPNYLSALFRKEMGKTFSDYLEEYRIERAQALLRDVRCKVYEVAGAVGYADPRHFAKVFKARTGQTPLEYRNMVLKG